MSARVSNPTHGTKVTDPNAPEIKEGAGAIAADSLAAESDRSGGGFSENRDSEPQSVLGANSTFANTNISGARTLDPVTSAAARDGETNWREGSKLNNEAQKSDTYQNGDASRNTAAAPSYVNSQGVDGGKPKGTNLTEGGFESDDSKNVSFNSEIGSKNDPGLAAENKIFRENANAASDSGFPTQKGEASENSFSTLTGDTSA